MFSKQNSLLRSIVTTVTCWKIVSFVNFLLKFLTSLLPHDHFTSSCRCGAHSEIIFVWLFLFMKLTKWLKQFWELFLPTSLESPQKINTPFFVKCVTSLSAVAVTVPVQATSSTKSLTTKFSLRLSCTLVMLPLAWLSPMHNIQLPLCCKALIVFTLPILVFLSLLFLVSYTVTMPGIELVHSLPCSKHSFCSLKTIPLFLDTHLKLSVDNLLTSIHMLHLHAMFCVTLLLLLSGFLSNSTQSRCVDWSSNRFSIRGIDCGSLLSKILAFLCCHGGTRSQLLVFAAVGSCSSVLDPICMSEFYPQ